MTTHPYSRWSDETEQILRAAGWFPGRDASDQVDRWRAELSRPGKFHMFAAAERALREYGGIRVDISGPGRDYARTSFQIDPMLAGWEVGRFAVYSRTIGVALFPLGLAEGGHCFLAIGEDGRVFISMVEVWLLGETMEDAVDALITGRKHT